MSTDRRAFLGGSLALGVTACIPPVGGGMIGRFEAQLRIIEAAAGGTLGVALLDTGSGLMLGINRETRFGLVSTFKTTLAAMVLAGRAEVSLDADRIVRWSEGELVTYSPFTHERLEQGATLLELAEATQKLSDNSAANILLRELGGPQAVTRFWRRIGDMQSRLDRTETELNSVPPGEIRDTTTPQAMARTLASLLYGNAIPAPAQRTLRAWMEDTRTGANRVRAGIPRGWRAGDKTGTSLWPGMGSLYADIGFVEPINGTPIIFSAFYRARSTHDRIDPEAQATLARVGEVIADYVREREPDAT